MFHNSDDLLKLRSAQTQYPCADEQAILKYLRSGRKIAATPGIFYDLLSAERCVIGSGDLLSDGSFVWPEYLAQYVEKYHVRLPDEFVEHARFHRWNAPHFEMSDDTEIEGFMTYRPNEAE